MTALLAGYPLWWLLGLADFMWILLAIPMAFRMVAWAAHGTRRIRCPAGLRHLAAVPGRRRGRVMVLSLTAPGTVVQPGVPPRSCPTPTGR